MSFEKIGGAPSSSFAQKAGSAHLFKGGQSCPRSFLTPFAFSSFMQLCAGNRIIQIANSCSNVVALLSSSKRWMYPPSFGRFISAKRPIANVIVGSVHIKVQFNTDEPCLPGRPFVLRTALHAIPCSGPPMCGRR